MPQMQQEAGVRTSTLDSEQNALMNKHSSLRQGGNLKEQERVIAGYNNYTPDTDIADTNSVVTVSGQLISQPLCPYEQRWQPLLAFNSTQAPIQLKGTRLSKDTHLLMTYNQTMIHK